MHAIDSAIRTFLAIKRAERRSPVTVRSYEQLLGLFRASLPPEVMAVEEITTEQCAAFLAAEEGRKLNAPGSPDRHMKATSLAARYRAMRVFLRWSSETYKFANPLVFKAPKIDIEPPRRASNEDVEALLASIDGDGWLDFRDRAIVRLLHGTGLRVQECASLALNDLDVAKRLVYVADGKGGKARYVPFTPGVAMHLLAYLLNRPAWSGRELLLGSVNRHGVPHGPLTANGIRQMLKRRCRAAGIAYINPHSLRHLFATKALNDGIPLSAVSTMMGHASTDFTARVYAKWLTDGLVAIYDAHWK
jgi:integrase/recombinase XerC